MSYVCYWRDYVLILLSLSNHNVSFIQHCGKLNNPLVISLQTGFGAASSMNNTAIMEKAKLFFHTEI